MPVIVNETKTAQKAVVYKAIASPRWSLYSRGERIALLNKARELEIDPFEARALQWKCSTAEARIKVYSDLTAQPGTDVIEC